MDETGQQLEAHLREHGDDQETWRVYGDWLTEQGDPRGEVVLLAGRLPFDEDGTLAERYQQLCSLAELKSGEVLQVLEWNHGFVRKVSGGGEWEVVEGFVELCNHPLGRFLVEAELGGNSGGDGLYPDEAEGLGQCEFKSDSLRKIVLHCSFGGSALGSAFRRLQGLEHLQVTAGGYEPYLQEYGLSQLPSIDMPRLRHLEIEGNYPFAPGVLPKLRDASMPALERLSIPLPEGHLELLLEAPWLAGVHDLRLNLENKALENRADEQYDQALVSRIAEQEEEHQLTRAFELDLLSLARHRRPLALKRLTLWARGLKKWTPSENLLRALAKASSLPLLERLDLQFISKEALDVLRSRLLGVSGLPSLQTIA